MWSSTLPCNFSWLAGSVSGCRLHPGGDTPFPSSSPTENTRCSRLRSCPSYRLPPTHFPAPGRSRHTGESGNDARSSRPASAQREPRTNDSDGPYELTGEVKDEVHVQVRRRLPRAAADHRPLRAPHRPHRRSRARPVQLMGATGTFTAARARKALAPHSRRPASPRRLL
jgi:hypothetical protein